MARKKITVVLTGSEQLNRKLLELTSSQAKAAIRKAARPALKPTLAAARANVARRTGRLARSIKIRALGRSRNRVGMRVTTSSSDNAFSGKTFYGAFQEWGWKTGARKSRVSSVAKRTTIQAKAEARRSAKVRPQIRRQIAGSGALKKAARSTRSQALRLYMAGIQEYIRSIASS